MCEPSDHVRLIVSQSRVEFVLKLSSPNAFASRTVTQWIPLRVRV